MRRDRLFRGISTTRRRRAGALSWRFCARSFGIVAALGLSACTVGPDFKPPESPTTQGYVAPDETTNMPDAGPGAEKQTVVAQKVAADWWMLFHSRDIAELAQAAIANNHELAAARSTLAQAHEAVVAAEGDLYPHIDLNGDVSRQRVNPVELGINAPATTFNLYSVGPVVSYALDPFGGNRRTVEREAALAEVQAYQLGAA